MPTIPRFVPLLSCLAAGGLLGAAEFPPWGAVNLRVSYEDTDNDWVMVDSAVPGERQERNWNDNHRFIVGGLWQPRRSGPLVGLSVFYFVGDDATGVETIEYERYGTRIEAGLAWSPPGPFQLELLPFASVGFASLEATSPGESDQNVGTYTEYGAAVQGLLTIPGVMQFGVGVGWLVSQSEHRLNLPSGDRTLSIEEDTLFFRIFAGVRF